jgi:hypothetical protein
MLGKVQKAAFLDKIENSSKKRPLEQMVDTDTTPSTAEKTPPSS